jgi:type II secretory pathway component PulM
MLNKAVDPIGRVAGRLPGMRKRMSEVVDAATTIAAASSQAAQTAPAQPKADADVIDARPTASPQQAEPGEHP